MRQNMAIFFKVFLQNNTSMKRLGPLMPSGHVTKELGGKASRLKCPIRRLNEEGPIAEGAIARVSK